MTCIQQPVRQLAASPKPVCCVCRHIEVLEMCGHANRLTLRYTLENMFLCLQMRGVDPVVTPPSRRGQDGLPPLNPGHGAMDPSAAGGLQQLCTGGFGSPPRQVRR